jgi:hypothetical protein
MAAIDDVMTTFCTEGVLSAELKIDVVPWMAGRMISRSKLSLWLCHVSTHL